MPVIKKGKIDYSEYQLKRIKEIRRLKAIDQHLNFISYTWKSQAEPFKIGYHTRIICDVIDNAIDRFRQGISSFYIITIPFRHGKSEIVSRKLPPHFLGLFPDHKVILTGHTSELTRGFSVQGRNLIDEDMYKDLFPEITVDPDYGAGDHWKIYDHEGECFATGIGGSMAGQGYSLGIMDDYCKNRADAESESSRNKAWAAFTDDFMTRRAPVSITIVLATRWHVDDLIGRAIKRKESDPGFPDFKLINIPAFDESYPTGTLFPERFSKAWYNEQRATLGEYGTASLLQNNPVVRGGNLLKIDNIQIHHSVSTFPDVVYTRVWDYAHTEKQRMKDDPDYTSGTLLAYTKIDGVWHLWIKHVARFQEEAPERDAKVIKTVDSDGDYTRLAVENTIDSRDAVATMRKLLRGKKVVIDATGKGDKVMRATPLESIFSAGNVHILYGEWNQPWLEEIGQFPYGKHDDQVDNLSAGYKICCDTTALSAKQQSDMAKRRQSKREARI